MGYRGIFDFRSDTVTRPTEEMRRAMYQAEVGDDVLRDDPTVLRLEELAAEKLGKEAALFVPSGTMGNTIALKVAVGEGNEILLEEKSHIYNFESGNVSRIVGALPRPLPSKRGTVPLEVLRENIHGGDRLHIPPTVALSLENTHNYWGGAVLKPTYLEEVGKFSREMGLHFHMDGARIFNAAVALGIPAGELASHAHSVMFCVSKGLSAPVGSLLVGNRELVERALRVRKFLGGAMRQAGILAAAGIVALTKMVDRLAEDHARARKLALGLSAMDGIEIDPAEVETNIVIFRLRKMEVPVFLENLKKEGILALGFGKSRVRMVLHKDLDDRDVEKALRAISRMMS